MSLQAGSLVVSQPFLLPLATVQLSLPSSLPLCFGESVSVCTAFCFVALWGRGLSALVYPPKEINGVKLGKSLFMDLHSGIELAALESSLKSEADNGPEDANILGGLNLRGWGQIL